MTSILDNDYPTRLPYHEGCGGTLLVGSQGTPEEHTYCDRCGYVCPHPEPATADERE